MKKDKIFYGLVICVMMLLYGTVSHAKILVIAPHPDDDILTSSGVIYNAVNRGEPVRIVYMTNGDLTGVSTGYTREGEAVNAEAYLGMAENNLYFLGYPDGFLDYLYTSCTHSTDTCSQSSQTVTYANRGLGSTDYHNYRFGSHANYNSYNMVKDLTDIISSFKPDHIFTYSFFDLHPDHSTTYLLLQDVLTAVTASDPAYNPTIHKTNLQINSADTWPASYDPQAYYTAVPNLSSITGLLWNDRESLDVPLEMQSTPFMKNRKFLALFSHKTQLGNINIYLLYIHKDEIFWTESPVAGNSPPIPNAGVDQTVNQGAFVTLHGSGSSSDPLNYKWVQTGGPSVTLSSSTVASPTFTVPTGLPQVQTLTFSLVVSDGTFTSVPDSVSIIPNIIDQNIAPLAVVTASTEAAASSQTAIKAVDGYVDGDLGYPGDWTKEWSTDGEGTGAWLQLNWPVSYSVDRVILYDRPNPDDHIMSATLHFSDGSTVPVGPLDNNGGGTEITFPSRTITNIRMTVDSVSLSTGGNVGLSEIEVYGKEPSKQNTLTTIGSSLNPSNYGQSVTFTATVTGGTTTTPTGTATFKDGTTVLGTVAVSGSSGSASATLIKSTLTVGPHAIMVVYNGDAVFAASASTPLTQTVNKIVPTVSVVSSSPTSTYGGSVTFTATVSSATTTPTGSVTFMDGVTTLSTGTLNGSGIATYITSTLSIAGSPHSITAVYSGDTNFSPSTSSAISQVVNKANQATLNVVATPSTVVYGSTAALSSSGGSGTGAVTYSVGASTGCVVSGATLTTLSVTNASGTCSVTATKAADANYNAAISSAATVTLQKANQTITFGALSIKAVGDANYSPGGTASSGLTVSYASSNTGVATIVGGNIHIISAGTTTITASQAGDTNYNTATPVVQGLTVAPATQTITVGTHAPASAAFNSTFNVAAAASSGLLVAITTSGGCSGSGSGSATITMTSGTTTCTVNYNQAGSVDFGAASQVTENTTAQKINQTTLNIVAPASLAYSSTVTLSTTGGSGTGVVSYSTGTSTGCSVAGSTLSVTDIGGSCSVTATKVADTNYNAATSSAAIVTLTKGIQATLTAIVTPSTVAYGSTAALSSSGGSGTGAVTYSAGASTGCSVAGSTLSVTDASGTCSVTATKAADTNYNAATSSAATVTLTTSPNGDLNGDNIVDIADALKALRFAAGLDTPTASDIAHGDVAPLVAGIRTPDGKIDISDVVAILRKAVGLSSW